MNTIKTRIVKIGNSQGIRIPKLLLDQTNFGEEVELEVQDNHIVIRASRLPRYGWEEQFKMMAEQGDDQLLDEPSQLSSWDEEDWDW
jgi:antitoxin MazE